jgi:diphthine-ammonia ligase
MKSGKVSQNNARFEYSNSHFFCSWSGGKDSALALYKTIQVGGKLSFLLTMMTETGERSRSHGIPKYVLEEQAICIGLPIRFCATSWNLYTENFLKELNFSRNAEIFNGVFGDIDIEAHYEWIETICHLGEISPWLPLWHMDRLTLLNELISLGFCAEIVAVKDGVLSPSHLGKTLDASLIDEFRNLGIDLCGETGEYHTIITNGPIFKKPLRISHGKQVLYDGYWFSDISLN